MNIKPRHDFRPCVPGAFTGGLARTEFFDGMVLSEADMKREQGYWRMKRRLTNRALGQGVVWGLSVAWDAKARCFTVCPGYGLSCCGDDLIVECPETVCEGDLVDVCSPDFRRLFARRDDPCARDLPDSPVKACLMLEYVECPEEPRQVFEDPCAEKPRGCRFGAVRETTRLRLAPPPPPHEGPLDRFCETIRKLIEDAGLKPPEPILARPTPGAVVSVTGFDTAVTTSFGGVSRAVGAKEGDHVELTRPPDAAARFRLSVEPAPGWIFTRSVQEGVEANPAQILMGVSLDLPFAADLAIDMAPLFGGDGVQTVYKISASSKDGAVTVTIRAASDKPIKRPVDCTQRLAEALPGAGDLGCTLRTLALAALTGFFRGRIGVAGCGGEKADKPGAMDETLAWLVTWLAWRAMFGVDTSKPKLAGVEKCLQRLFEEWCCGFAYRGPQCDGDAHGVILGCVEISPKGKILGFDAWGHRRYVLTGPLLTHWAGQFGVAPLDVTASRLAGWICCVAASPMAAKPAFDFANAESAYLPVGGFGLGFSSGFGSAQAFNGVKVKTPTTVVSPVDFVAHVLRALALGPERPRLAAAAAIRRVGMQGSDLFLLEPMTMPVAVVGPEMAGFLQAIRRETDAAPPMVRKPMADFSQAVAAQVPVADLRPVAASALTGPLTKALETVGIGTAGDLIAAGPEAALAQAQAAPDRDPALADRPAAEKAMALLYGAAEGLLVKAAAAVAEAANARPADDPFTRADLADPATLSAVRRATAAHVQTRGGLPMSALRDGAARVIDAGP